MKCHVCGKKATMKTVDPFDDEMPELMPKGAVNEEEWWCNECYQARSDDI